MAGVYTILVRMFDLPRDFNAPAALAAGIYYGSIGLVALGGAVIGVLILLRHVPAIGRTAAAITVLTPLSAVVIVPLLMLFARSTGYSTSISTILIEITLSIAGFAAVTTLARRWSLAHPLKN